MASIDSCISVSTLAGGSVIMATPTSKVTCTVILYACVSIVCTTWSVKMKRQNEVTLPSYFAKKSLLTTKVIKKSTVTHQQTTQASE